MSGNVVKPSSFSDEANFDLNSLPELTYTEAENTTVTPEEHKKSSKTTQPLCYIDEIPWPTIIVIIIGGTLVIYTAIGPNLNDNRRLFGVVLITLWTIVWALILWVLWKKCHKAPSWWLLLIPVGIMVLFFVLIIILNIGAP